MVDTRAFVVKHSGEKQRRWSQQIDDLVLRSGRRPVQAKDLVTLLGRLNNASYVIPYARHFTGRLYKAWKRAEAKETITLSMTAGFMWLNFACDMRMIEPNACAVATVNSEGRPSNRFVLLKDFDARGFVFFTNY